MEEENTTKKRLYDFIKAKGIKMKHFEEKCNLCSGYVTSMRNRPSEETLGRILKAFPDLNPEWLLYGEGEMFAGKNSAMYFWAKVRALAKERGLDSFYICRALRKKDEVSFCNKFENENEILPFPTIMQLLRLSDALHVPTDDLLADWGESPDIMAARIVESGNQEESKGGEKFNSGQNSADPDGLTEKYKKIAELQNQIKDKDKQIKELQGQIEKKNNEISTLQEREKEIEENNKEMQKYLFKMFDHASNLDKRLEKHVEDLRNVNKRVVDLAGRINNVNKILETLQSTPSKNSANDFEHPENN